MDKEKYLPRLPFWDKLSETERQAVSQGASLRSFERGQLIFGCHDDCLGMLLLLKGGLRAFMVSEEGREVTLFRLSEGDCDVLSASCVIRQISFDTSLTAERDCQALIIGADTVARLAQANIYARCFIFELATERFSSVMWSMQQILFKGFDRRLAGFLVSEYERTGSPELRMTHEQLAQHTSSAREVVARMLKRFSADGLVEYRRGCIRLTDIDTLKKMI